MTCDSRNHIYIVICQTCKEEYIIESRLGNSKLRDRIKIYRQHILHLEHEKLKVKRHFRTCGKGNLTIFSLLQLHSNNIGHWQEYKYNFMKKYKTKLNR